MGNDFPIHGGCGRRGKEEVTMKIKLSAVILVFIIIFAASCKTPDTKLTPQREESRKTHYGKAVITEIIDAKDNTRDDNRGYVEIYFNFIPSDPKAADNYLCRECPDRRVKLFYDNRDSFHLNWVKKWEIKPGNEYPAIRHEMTRDDKSTPVSHEVILEPAKK